ncbi:alkaline phosphatase-like [Macrobrachium rosenbergii]|uniref:alkaline phosphatase-like n=1 Tax=Macrobrachium rosenbergii TaxID=79674 RepID=UPI0034D4787E
MAVAAKEALLLMVMMLEIVLFLPPTLVSAKEEENREFWYSQAKSQMAELFEGRRSSKGYAKNVILFVGDGMGLSTVTAGRILKGQRLGQSGERYRLSFEKFPFVALAKTYNLDSQIGDSSACATALMCGVKANINTVGLDHRGIFEDCKSAYAAGVPSLVDWAQKHGKSTGIVTNTRLTHGTPSALYAKTPSRYWEDDTKVPAESQSACKDIARQLVENQPGRNINVLLGGGRRHWIPETEHDPEEKEQMGRRADGLNLLDAWVHDKKMRGLNAEYVWNKAQFDGVDPRHTDFLLGLFGYTHLDFEADRNHGPEGDPSLSEMTKKAIEVLRKNSEGFFLMVEAGRIDHAHHHNNARRALEEVDALDEAVLTALNLTDAKDTLVVLTADHSHVFTIGGHNTPRGHPVTDVDAEVSDVDGKPYTILLYGNGPGYAHSTPAGRQDLTDFNTQDINFVQQAAVPKKYETHSGEDVPVYAQGPGSYLFSGIIEQTYIPHAIAYALCITEDNSHCGKEPEDACRSLPAPSQGKGKDQDVSLPPVLDIHSVYEKVVVHLPDQDYSSVGKHDPRTAYEPFPIQDSPSNDLNSYPGHALASAHEPESDYGRAPVFVPARHSAPGAELQPTSKSSTISNQYAASNSYSDTYNNGVHEDPKHFPAYSPIPADEPVLSRSPTEERNQGRDLPTNHESPTALHPYTGQDPLSAEDANSAPAPMPIPATTSRRPLSHTTPATEDFQRSIDPWTSRGVSESFSSRTNSHRFITITVMFLITLLQIQ